MVGEIGAVLVTYRRPRLLPIAFERLAEQHRSLRRLILIDNDPQASAQEVVATQPASDMDVEYLNPGDNIGPAGGFSLGMQRLLETAADEDAILLLDDNDPLPPFDIIESQMACLNSLSDTDPAAVGVGLHGATFDWWRARARTVSTSERLGTVRVDHLHGGGYPLYRADAVRRVGTFSAPLFFGFEELEFGLRLTTNGYHLYLNGPLSQRQLAWRRTELISRSRPSFRVEALTWRRYYSLRNLLHILLLHGRQKTAIRVAAVRGMGKPIANIPATPRLAAEHLRWNYRAIADAFGGRMGRTVDPSP